MNPIEGYENTSGEVREKKYKGGDESMCFREKIMGEKERNRDWPTKLTVRRVVTPPSFFSQLMCLENLHLLLSIL